MPTSAPVRLLSIVLFVLLPVLPATAQEQGPQDLRALLAPGFLLADTNGDGHVDRIPARIRLAPGTGAAGIAAAADLAARLGFESYASHLDLLLEPGEDPGDSPVLLIGTDPEFLGGLGVDPDQALGGLAPGEGRVARLPAGPGLPAGGVWLAGGDATGLLAASAYLAGRYPSVWMPEGPELDEWADELADALAGSLAGAADDVDPDSVAVEPPPGFLALEHLVVAHGRDGLQRLAARVSAATPTDSERLNAHVREQGDELLPAGLQRLDLLVQSPDAADRTHRILPDRAWSAPSTSEWQPRDVPDFTLSELYTTSGIYRDTNQDLVPDRTEAVLSLDSDAAPRPAVALANRIGLETGGIRLPMARVAGQNDRPESEGFPILFGVDHYRTARLAEDDRLAVPTGAPGEGFVEFVSEALDGKHALVVSGTDAAGLEAAARLVAGRLPYLNGYEKGQFGLSDLETEVRRFFQARSVGGTTALALAKLEQWITRLEQGERPHVPASDAPWPPSDSASAPAGPLERIEVEIALDTVPDGLQSYLTAHLQARLADSFPDTELGVQLHPSGFGAGEPVFDEPVEIPWEVDRLRDRLAESLYPAVGDTAPGLDVEIRVSEPPEIRRALADEVRAELESRGADPERTEVRVINAYKQGFSWIEDHVLPRLRDTDVARIEIRYHHLRDSDELPWQVVGSDTRWLQELFPIDAVLARELDIEADDVVFQPTGRADPVYHLRALDGSGEPILDESFTPTWDVRPYFGLHDDYERVRVSTGWVRAESAAGETLLDERLPTDMERFWDYWQGEIQPRLRDYLMDLHEGEITGGTAPFFDELRIEARLSEPNHRIGIDEEHISALESLHNDLYFTSIAYFSHLGNHYGVGGLSYPGRILPHIDPSGAGEAVSGRVTLTGRSHPEPRLTLRARSDGEWGRWRYDLEGALPTEPPKLRGLSVIAGTGDAASADPATRFRDEAARLPVHRALFEVMAEDSIDRWPEYRTRTSEAAVDRSFLPVELLEGMVQATRELHGAGVLEHALAFEGVQELAFCFRVEPDEDADEDADDAGPDPDADERDAADEPDDAESDNPDRGFERFVTLPASGNPLPTTRPVLRAEGFERPQDVERGEGLSETDSMVQWDTPMPPAESDSIMARLAMWDEVTVYHVGQSYLGKDLFAADFLPPIEGPYRSELKLTALRPTLLLSARQHANEVSSTSHLLRLGERLVRDPEYRDMLGRVNVVLHPITNADGAQLAYEMQQVNPDFTLHAGYLGSLGVDATSGGGSDPIYPESQVRPMLQAMWLPDIYINLHGYPSHEWVQHFSGYAAWVRGRTVTQRTWWAPRGWFIPGFSWVDDPDHPDIEEAQFAILDSLAAAITGEPRVQAMNERQYARYRKYGRQDVEGFREYFHNDMLVYLSLTGRPASGSGPTSPRIMTFSATTEAPDETARGDWLKLVSTAGIAHTSALLRYLESGIPRVEREAEAFSDAVSRVLYRERPVLPPEVEEPDDG